MKETNKTDETIEQFYIKKPKQNGYPIFAFPDFGIPKLNRPVHLIIPIEEKAYTLVDEIISWFVTYWVITTVHQYTTGCTKASFDNIFPRHNLVLDAENLVFRYF